VHVVAGRVQLLAADVFGAVNHLPLQVGVIHYVEVDQSDSAYACAR
jgi:hypothetical protein